MAKTEASITALWAEIGRLTDEGELRRLSGAFARFVASLGNAAPPLVLAATELSDLADGQAAAALLGWSEEQWKALASSAAPLPRSAKAWAAQLAACEQVWQVDEFDYDQPLVLDGERLYLRRYWRDELLVAQSVRERARSLRPVDGEAVRGWLDTLFASQRAAEKPDWQKLACAIALRGAVGIITGGPGTGKT